MVLKDELNGEGTQILLYVGRIGMQIAGAP